ncbi:MAG TPA: SLC13 family permease [Steroidobacteraceae bacterium]|nr:SLC13 family permease [Steroidobacteraceae bacterium]
MLHLSHAPLAQVSVWLIALLVIAGILARPWQLPEALWAVLGAVALLLLGLVSWHAAGRAALKGTDVYLFLAGMLLLSELARREGLFDYLAALAVRRARGSAQRLFALVYGVGIIVTALLSNDATAVVLTPAVYAAARAARADPLPHLFACALIANAASFLLPISNPANLVLYDAHLPALASWLARFTLPSVLAIAATYGMLRLTQAAALRVPIATDVPVPRLSHSGRLAALGIALTAVLLLSVSALGRPLGLPTCLAGAASVACVHVRERRSPGALLRAVSWSILPLVAGLFVLVAALAGTGITDRLGADLHALARHGGVQAGALAGIGVALASNVLNNLPTALIAASAASVASVPASLVAALLIGVDLGPNLSVTGSLATLLWLLALRREGEQVSPWRFLRLGACVMPPALLLALGALLL